MQNNLDIQKAWNVVKEDKDKVKKIAIGVGIMVANIVLGVVPVINAIAGIVASCIFTGYFVNNARTRAIKPESGLCEWGDIKETAITGAKAWVVFLIAFILIVLVPSAIAFSLSGMHIIPKSAIALVSFIFYFVFLAYAVTAMPTYASTLDYKLLYNPDAIKKMINKDKELYQEYLLKMVLYGILSSVITTLLAITVIGILLIPIAAMIFLYLFSDLMAQYIKKVFNMGQDVNGES